MIKSSSPLFGHRRALGLMVKSNQLSSDRAWQQDIITGERIHRFPKDWRVCHHPRLHRPFMCHKLMMPR
jgi:hypothetical protein